MKINLTLVFLFISFLSRAQINDSNVKLLLNKISQTELSGDTISNDYANLINNLAIYYTNKGMYSEAEPLFVKVSRIRNDVYGDNHISYATSLNNLAFLYQKQERFIEAELLLLKSLKIEESVLGSDNLNYLDSYEMLGFIYENQNKYDNALKIFNDVLQKRKINQNKSYVVTFSSVLRLNCLMDEDSNYNYLENLCLKYLSETEGILGKKDPLYMTGLLYLASFYENNDVLYFAEKKYEEIIDIKKNILKEDINSIYPSYESLANIYAKVGNYQLAERLHQFVLDKKIENNLSKYEIARSYNNLGSVYMDQFKYDLALSNYLIAIQIIEKENFLERQDYATYLNNLGLLYLKLDKYELAEVSLTKALKINEKLSDQFSNGYLMVYSNLAALYEKLGRCNDAEKYYLISINNSKNKNRADFKNRFLSLSKVYQCLNDIINEKKKFDKVF
jgi:tetratricopeptide (TPR) repeat protein